MALEDGPKFPADVAKATGLEFGTVKNTLTSLRNNEKVEYTGNKDGQSNEVRKMSSVSFPKGDGDSNTYQHPLSYDAEPGEVTNLDDLK